MILIDFLIQTLIDYQFQLKLNQYRGMEFYK